MALRRLVLAALLAAASLAIVAGAVSGGIVAVPRDPPDSLDALTADLLELWDEGKDADERIEPRSGADASCAGCHGRSLVEEAEADRARLRR